MISGAITSEEIEKLPPEIKSLVRGGRVEPDEYAIRKHGDHEYETRFLSKEEVEGVLRALPLEITFANKDYRIKFYTRSSFSEGFVRTKTTIGRRIEYCHLPRLEKLVKKTADEVLSGRKPYKEFWTRLGDRVMRVIIAPVRNRAGEIIGVLEIVEDLTDIVENVERIKKSVVVL